MYLDLLELQARAASDKATDPKATNDLHRRLTEVEEKVDRILDLLNNNPSANRRC